MFNNKHKYLTFNYIKRTINYFVSSRFQVPGYIHSGRSTSAARIAAFNPTYAAAPRTMRSRCFNHPTLGMARFISINLIVLEERNNELAGMGKFLK